MFSGWDEYQLMNYELSALARRTPESELGQVVGDILATPGKRVRPIILILSAKAFGASTKQCVDAALAIELVHVASLIHDDILDFGIERRGMPSAIQKYGSEAALLAGDYLISMSIELISSYEPIIIRAFSHACLKMANGEMLDLTRTFSEDDYYRCISQKTASLFASSAKIGCLIANALESDISLFERYGKNLGLAYQILDDLEEYLGINQGKLSQKDSITLPRILCEIYPEKEAIQMCMQAASRHSSAAKEALDGSSGSAIIKDRLRQIVAQMTHRGLQRCRSLKSLC